MFERGKVVLVPFPFTDLSSQKVRPAIIVSRPSVTPSDVIVVFVSSVLPQRPAKTEIVVRAEESDFSKTGLKISSVIKCHKIATLDRRIILGELGEVSPSLQKHIDAGLLVSLDLKKAK